MCFLKGGVKTCHTDVFLCILRNSFTFKKVDEKLTRKMI